MALTVDAGGVVTVFSMCVAHSLNWMCVCVECPKVKFIPILQTRKTPASMSTPDRGDASGLGYV